MRLLILFYFLVIEWLPEPGSKAVKRSLLLSGLSAVFILHDTNAPFYQHGINLGLAMQSLTSYSENKL